MIKVANTGRWVTAGGHESTGTGLHSLERLLLGPSATVNHHEEEGWVRVRLRLPILTADQWPATSPVGTKHA